MGMVGGGRGAFIGGVHRRAAALDGQIELIAGAFSSDPKKIGSFWKRFFYRAFTGLFLLPGDGKEGKCDASGRENRLCFHRGAQSPSL